MNPHWHSPVTPLLIHFNSILFPLQHLVVIAVHQKLRIVNVVRLRTHGKSSHLFGKEVVVIFVSRRVTVSNNLLISKNDLFFRSELLFDESKQRMIQNFKVKQVSILWL